MRIHHTDRYDKRSEVPLTSMIDVVFMLLIYFLVTFQVPIKPEGAFDIYMPGCPGDGDSTALTAAVRMKSDESGALTYLGYGETCLWSGRATTLEEIEPTIADANAPPGGFVRLFQKVLAQVNPPDIGTGTGTDVEIILDCDDRLAYQFVIEAITRVRGRWITDEKGRPVIQHLADKVQFSRPRLPVATSRQ